MTTMRWPRRWGCLPGRVLRDTLLGTFPLDFWAPRSWRRGPELWWLEGNVWASLEVIS